MPLIKLLEDPEVKKGVQWVMKKYQEGDVIVEEGSPGSEMFLIYSGSVDILSSTKVTDEQESQQRIAQLQHGDFFGEMAIFSEDLRSATVVAANECELVMIDGSTLLNFMDENPEKGYFILRHLFEGLVQRMRSNNDRASAIMGFYLREVG
ncbi:MAG: cyclic nucleotide-binding domain-containing protein [Methylococcaceae bacterium]|nr:cyclic nucleotide-binding domain-containing protein [Methylococcaceae bacterium]